MVKGKIGEFNGFSKETLFFFKQLKKNNNKEWFKQNRKLYDDYVIEPAKSFIVDMGERLKELTPEINADPRTNKSLFRINRDTRFSKDKSPYKTNLAALFWQGRLPRMESSSFYFHLETDRLMLGAGIYRFNKKQLEEYRNSVVHPKYGAELKKISKALSAKGLSFEGKHYKRYPKGFDEDHENSDFLLHDGLYIGKDYDIPEEFYSTDFIDFCFKRYKSMYPAQKWLFELTKRASKK